MLKEYIKEYIDFSIEENQFDQDLANDFVLFCIQQLQITNPPNVSIVEDIPGGTHGAYHPYENYIMAVGSNRHLADILRSIAHELVHHKQNELGTIHHVRKDGIGGFIEDEANAIAGQLVKAYGKQNRNLYYLGK